MERKKTNEFDGISLIVGEYGIGVLYAAALNWMKMTTADALIEFVILETNIRHTSDGTYVCVDEDDLVEV